MSNYKSLFETELNSDSEWLLNGKTYKLHSKIISLHSDFFKTYYENLEKMGKSDSVIEILDAHDKCINTSYIDYVIKFLYDDLLFPIDLNNTNINDIISYLYCANMLVMNKFQEQLVSRITRFLQHVIYKYSDWTILGKFENKNFKKYFFRDRDADIEWRNYTYVDLKIKRRKKDFPIIFWQLRNLELKNNKKYIKFCIDNSEVLKNLLKEDNNKIYGRFETDEIAKEFRSEMLSSIKEYKFVVIPNDLKVLKYKDYEYLRNFIANDYDNLLLKMISDEKLSLFAVTVI